MSSNCCIIAQTVIWLPPLMLLFVQNCVMICQIISNFVSKYFLDETFKCVCEFDSASKIKSNNRCSSKYPNLSYITSYMIGFMQRCLGYTNCINFITFTHPSAYIQLTYTCRFYLSCKVIFTKITLISHWIWQYSYLQIQSLGLHKAPCCL